MACRRSSRRLLVGMTTETSSGGSMTVVPGRECEEREDLHRPAWIALAGAGGPQLLDRYRRERRNVPHGHRSLARDVAVVGHPAAHRTGEALLGGLERQR